MVAGCLGFGATVLSPLLHALHTLLSVLFSILRHGHKAPLCVEKINDTVLATLLNTPFALGHRHPYLSPLIDLALQNQVLEKGPPLALARIKMAMIGHMWTNVSREEREFFEEAARQSNELADAMTLEAVEQQVICDGQKCLQIARGGNQFLSFSVICFLCTWHMLYVYFAAIVFRVKFRHRFLCWAQSLLARQSRAQSPSLASQRGLLTCHKASAEAHRGVYTAEPHPYLLVRVALRCSVVLGCRA